MRAALDQVNDGGLESLTMRRLAERLGTHLPTIYRLYADKDALLDDMAESILASALASRDPDATEWSARARRLATGLRSALLAQRDGARIVGGNYAAKRNNLSFVDTLVGCMRDARLPGETALWSASTVFCFVLGEALEQQGAGGDEVGVLLDAVSMGGFHHLSASPVQHLFDFDARFDFGLELILGGVRRYTA
ncbi:TetR/AcrR family transcriptional regulator C-terminal domain-containing protein [Amycolatopsis endophytica]